MNEFYLDNSYIPFLDSAQLVSGSQGIVYFNLFNTGFQESLNILPNPAASESEPLQQEVLNLLPAPGGSGY